MSPTAAWVTGVLSKEFARGKQLYFLDIARRRMFNEFTYSIRLIIVYKLTIFYFYSLIIFRECQRSALLLGLFLSN